MYIVVAKFLTSKKIKGITLFPFIFIAESQLKGDKILLNHEKIHIRQQIELAVFFFYLWYLIEFLYYFLRFKNKNKAYRAISFEKEAYENEKNLTYLTSRKYYNFINYIDKR